MKMFAVKKDSAKWISVLIPAYNESDCLPATIDALRTAEKYRGIFHSKAGEILVIDDGSTDQTAVVAADSGARVIRFRNNLGKGQALATGLTFAQGEIILMVDADLQTSAGEALKLVEPIFKDEADLTVAVFLREKAGNGFGLARKTAQQGIKHLTGVTVEAPLSGQRAAKRRVLEHLLPFAAGFGIEVGMYIDALRHGYRIKEMPLDLVHCPPGKNLAGILHRGKQFYQICLTLKAKAHEQSKR